MKQKCCCGHAENNETMQVVPSEMSYDDWRACRPSFAQWLEDIAEVYSDWDCPPFWSTVVNDEAKYDGAWLPREEKGVFIIVPPEYDFCLPILASQKPAIVNYKSLDHLWLATMFEWECTVPGFQFVVLMHAEAMSLLPLSGAQSRSVFIPVVAIAGKRVVAGGFWFDANDLMTLHEALSCSRFYQPDWILSEKEFREAEREMAEIGDPAWPEAGKLWRHEFGDTYVVIVPTY